MIRYDAMKWGMLMNAPTHACAPAPISTRSVRPVSRRGTNTISDSPPTHSRSMAGEMIAEERRETVLLTASASAADGGSARRLGRHAVDDRHLRLRALRLVELHHHGAAVRPVAVLRARLR